MESCFFYAFTVTRVVLSKCKSDHIISLLQLPSGATSLKRKSRIPTTAARAYRNWPPSSSRLTCDSLPCSVHSATLVSLSGTHQAHSYLRAWKHIVSNVLSYVLYPLPRIGLQVCPPSAGAFTEHLSQYSAHVSPWQPPASTLFFFHSYPLKPSDTFIGSCVYYLCCLSRV